MKTKLIGTAATLIFLTLGGLSVNVHNHYTDKVEAQAQQQAAERVKAEKQRLYQASLAKERARVKAECDAKVATYNKLPVVTKAKTPAPTCSKAKEVN